METSADGFISSLIGIVIEKLQKAVLILVSYDLVKEVFLPKIVNDIKANGGDHNEMPWGTPDPRDLH
ncbi:MAG: hypothetical protein IJJ19_01560 [Erysipelotrichaceae bacterium]|nr:hypothetical protein [Erysipelotrichaceae bacterium]